MTTQERMKTCLESIDSELRDLRKQLKSNRHDSKISSRIERREVDRKFYMKSKTEPVRFSNGMVFNGKLIKSYLKKLPLNAVVNHTFTSDGLIIEWEAFKGDRGKFTMLNLSERYGSFDLPNGEVLFE